MKTVLIEVTLPVNVTIEHVYVPLVKDTKHEWVCINSGIYDSIYKCQKCQVKQTWSMDNKSTELPTNGCKG